MEDIRLLVPQHKQDLGRAKAAVEAGYPAVSLILPALLEWLQDYNWPVAHVLAPFLARIGTPIIPHVRRVLDSGDDIWKYHVLSSVVAYSPEVAAALRYEIERLASSPTPNEMAEGVSEVAQGILDGLSGGSESAA